MGRQVVEGRKEGKRLRRGKGSKFRESRFPGIWFTYWVYMYDVMSNRNS